MYACMCKCFCMFLYVLAVVKMCRDVCSFMTLSPVVNGGRGEGRRFNRLSGCANQISLFACQRGKSFLVVARCGLQLCAVVSFFFFLFLSSPPPGLSQAIVLTFQPNSCQNYPGQPLAIVRKGRTAEWEMIRFVYSVYRVFCGRSATFI